MGVPINWIILVIGASWVADISARHFQSTLMTSIPVARQMSLVILVSWAIWRLINRIEARQIDKGNDPTTVQLVGKIAKITVSILMLLPILQALGVTFSGVLAFGGVGGLVVGLAAKDLLANFFGSVVIHLDRPFKVGDWIRSPDREIEGVVEHIGFRVTCIRTFEKRPLYVPNSIFTNISVENPSRMLNRRIFETIGVRYEDSSRLRGLLEEAKSMLTQHPGLDSNQIIMANFTNFGASSLDFFVYAYTKTREWAEYHEVKQDVLLQLIDIIHQHGADCAFPTRTLHLDSTPEALLNALNSKQAGSAP
ncbi:MAG: mechanosensitive ion channel family protein [Oceanobacter sp.]